MGINLNRTLTDSAWNEAWLKAVDLRDVSSAHDSSYFRHARLIETGP